MEEQYNILSTITYIKHNWDSFSIFKIPMEKMSNEKDSPEIFDINYKRILLV